MRRDRWIALLVFAATLAAFAPALANGFVDFDDPEFVTGNPFVRAGLTGAGVRWAFTTGYPTNWVPLAALSHMLDVELFGLAPAAHHATSILLHALSATLVFIVFRRLTGAPARSAVLALLFGLHPLRVESVAWVSERRDVLSMAFGLLAILAYVRWVQRRGATAYAAALVAFGLSLLSKASFVTLPALLLVLDYWPLSRIGAGRMRGDAGGLRRCAVEKLPFLALSLAASFVTLQAQVGALAASESLPLGLRIPNALDASVVYLRQSFWPTDLAVLVPHPGVIPGERLAADALVLGLVSLVSVHERVRQPWLLAGWLWYLVALVPVSGLVQVGVQAHADRYTYLSSLGLAWMLVWSVPARWGARSVGRVALAAFATGVLGALALATRAQIRVWRDGVTLFQHTLAVTHDNFLAERHLGVAFSHSGRQSEAESALREALRLRPGYVQARYDLALVLVQQGRPREARAELEGALAADPGYADAHTLLATLLAESGDAAASLAHFEEAARLHPADAAVQRNLGLALAQAGRGPEAEAALTRALRLDPGSADAHAWLGFLLAARGAVAPAKEELETALRLDPGHAGARESLSRLHAGRPAP